MFFVQISEKVVAGYGNFPISSWASSCVGRTVHKVTVEKAFDMNAQNCVTCQSPFCVALGVDSLAASLFSPFILVKSLSSIYATLYASLLETNVWCVVVLQHEVLHVVKVFDDFELGMVGLVYLVSSTVSSPKSTQYLASGEGLAHVGFLRCMQLTDVLQGLTRVHTKQF